jgi:ketosteroid isomerase-like protein
MNRRRFALALTFLLTAQAIRADDPTEKLEKAIAALNDAFTRGDAETIKRLTTEGHTAITPYYGLTPRAEQIKSLPDLKLSEYTAGKLQVTMLSRDVAQITYSLTMKGTYKGHAVPTSSIARAIWVLKGDQWLEASYQETAVTEK